MTDTLELQQRLAFMVAASLPELYGNPGNMTVYCQLVEKKFEVPTDKCLDAFRKKYPQYAHEDGWLWVLYKVICEKDINKTIKELRDMVMVHFCEDS